MNISDHEKKKDQLLDRIAPKEYTQELTEIYSQESDQMIPQTLSPYFIFSLCNEWFGISVKSLKEVVNSRSIHSIPHRSNEILLGTVNIEGQFKLVVSIKKILCKSEKNNSRNNDITEKRMVVLKQEEQNWVIIPEDILGIRYINLEEIQNNPLSMSNNNQSFLRGIIYIENKHAGIIDEDFLFQSLKKSIA